MARKIRVGVLFGGKSVEHEVSLISAKNVIAAMDREKYEIILIGIDKNGQWHVRDVHQFLHHVDNARVVHLADSKHNVALISTEQGQKLVSLSGQLPDQSLDVVFPVLHGTYGEDGTVQGLLKLTGIAFVGAGVLGSAVGMDKDVMKRLLREAGLPVAKFIAIHQHQKDRYSFEDIVGKLGLPFFIKPANLGSSVGISKIKSKNDFSKALDDAFLYDRKVLIEEFLKGRELECAVLGNEHPICSLPGEIIPQHEFYSYEAKYLDENGAVLKAPADLDQLTVAKVQKLALEAYRVLCCEGMGRVDFFLKENGDLFINEINTIPGFTQISMYPKMWEASGISYTRLIDELIRLAIDRFDQEKKLKTTF
jgi:D-alanine-D-alanine ligase